MGRITYSSLMIRRMSEMAKNLIIYYSRKGENYVNGRIKSLAKGNTELCVEYIQKASFLKALYDFLNEN